MIKNPYGSLITKGLGFAATKSLITAKYGLFSFSLEVEVIKPPISYGGGGAIAWGGSAGGFTYRAAGGGYRGGAFIKGLPSKLRTVRVRLTLPDGTTVKREYKVTAGKTKAVVKAIHITDKTIKNIAAAVEYLAKPIRKIKVSHDK